MITAALVFAGTGRVAARLHLHDGIVDLDHTRTRATFGTTAEEAETTKLLAFNRLLQPLPGDRHRCRHRRGCVGTPALARR